MDHGGGDQIIESHINGSDLTIILLICLFFSQRFTDRLVGILYNVRGERLVFLYEKFPVASYNPIGCGGSEFGPSII